MLLSELQSKDINYFSHSRRRRLGLASVAFIAVLAFLLGGASASFSATQSNAQSPLGINLAPLGINSSELPFLDNFKANSGWITHSSSTWDTSEEQYLNLDSNGWPISLNAVNEHSTQQFNSVGTLILRNIVPTANGIYPGGQYIVLYQGQGTITYSFDAVKNTSASTPGRDVINVTPSTGGGISITITSTDPNHTGNYIRNIQVVQAAYETALTSGQTFNPKFLALIQNFRVLRFMDWFSTNGSQLSSWSNRTLLTSYNWSSSYGAPVEVAVKLANATGADTWLNIPHMADDNYITQMATLVHSQLGASQKVYVEFSNEVWNGAFPQYAYAATQGQALWPTQPGGGGGYVWNRNWYGMRVAQMCDIWKSTWGSDSGRVVCVMGAQAAGTSSLVYSMQCTFWSGAPCSGHGIGAVAIAPYFGNTVPSSFTSQSDGGLASLFASLTSQNDPSIPVGGYLTQSSGWEAAYPPILASYNLPLVAYEGGQGFESFPNGLNSDGSNNAMTNLFIAANRDSRMGTAYSTYLAQWKANGGQLFMHYNDVGSYSQYGEWGALESIMQTTVPLSSAPPKWQALQNFISQTPCWWSGCTGTVTGSTVSAVPMAPTNLQVH